MKETNMKLVHNLKIILRRAFQALRVLAEGFSGFIVGNHGSRSFTLPNLKSSSCDEKAEVVCESVIDPLVGDASKCESCELIDDSTFETSKFASGLFLCNVSNIYRHIESDEFKTYMLFFPTLVLAGD